MNPIRMIKRLLQLIDPRKQKLILDYPVQFKPRYGHGLAPHNELYNLISKNRNQYEEILKDMLQFEKYFVELQDAKAETDPKKPGWNNGFLPGLDILGIYTMLAKYSPSKYIEIGSGNSTKVAYKAKMDQHLSTQLISIDPAPRAEIDALADQVIREPFENIDIEFLLGLEENDILFVDNSHRILPNSDSMVFYMEILPKLKKGVIVHIHDIYLPYDYPQFMCDRFYSEQYGLAFFLLANPEKYKTLLPNYYISQDKELSGILSPLWPKLNQGQVERHGGSFWLKINS
jgi:hypothetical protein